MAIWSQEPNPNVRDRDELNALRDRTAKVEGRVAGIEQAQQRTEANLARFIEATTAAAEAQARLREAQAEERGRYVARQEDMRTEVDALKMTLDNMVIQEKRYADTAQRREDRESRAQGPDFLMQLDRYLGLGWKVVLLVGTVAGLAIAWGNMQALVGAAGG